MLGIVSAAVIAAVVLVLAPWDPYRTIWYQDQYTVLTEPSPDDIVAIADRTGMSEAGRLIYLASTPAIEDADSFNQDCSVESEGTLGCFDGRNIFIYSVTDDRLAGTIEVTAAHEMLHAAYNRLTPEDRTHLDTLVADFIASLPADDPTFATLEAGYDLAQYADEWNSRIGTEYADLPAELEAHYATYFSDRSKVLGLYGQSKVLLDQYEQQLTDLQAQVDDLDAALTTQQATFDAASTQLGADIAAFNARADGGSFTSQAQFDRERNALVAQQDALTAELAALNAEIERYNGLVDQLVALDADYADLYQQLDSTNPPPTV